MSDYKGGKRYGFLVFVQLITSHFFVTHISVSIDTNSHIVKHRSFIPIGSEHLTVNSGTLCVVYLALHSDCMQTSAYCTYCLARAAERIGGAQGKYKKWAPENGLCEGGLGARPQEILHALKCVPGAPEALFHACTQYIYTCKLPSSISGFRTKSTTYGALTAQWPCKIIICISSIKRKAKSRLTSIENTANQPLKEARLECD